MSSIPNRQLSTASSVTSTASNQNSSNLNKKQQVKQTKPTASGGKPGPEASSINDVSGTTIQPNPNGPPIIIPPKVVLSKAERRALQVSS